MIALRDYEREIRSSPPVTAAQSPDSIGRSVCKWSAGVESLISFHFSLLPFFESKKDSDTSLRYEDKSAAASPESVSEMQKEDEKYRNLDTIFVKTIFPFIERREHWERCGS